VLTSTQQGIACGIISIAFAAVLMPTSVGLLYPHLGWNRGGGFSLTVYNL